MKILLITEFFPTGKDLRFSGGVEARTFFIAKYLSKNNQVTVLASRTKGTPTKEKLFNFTVFRVGPSRSYTASVGHFISRVAFIKDAVQFGKTLDMDIVDAGNYICHFIGKRIATHKKVPIVVWYPDVWLKNWVKNAGLYGIFGEILELYNLKTGFDSYITISNETAEKLKKYVKKNNIEVIYCGIDKSEFRNLKEKFPNPTMMCVSRFASYKNIKTLIFAFAHLKKRIKNAQLILVGSGSQLKSLNDQIKNLNISTHVKIFSNLPRNKLLDLYSRSHIFSLPSLVEGFGIATIEAAATGLPYVNSDIPIQREVTRGGKGGFLVDPLNPIAFSNKFFSLLTNKKLYMKKSNQAKILSSKYNWAEVSFQTERVYNSIL